VTLRLVYLTSSVSASWRREACRAAHLDGGTETDELGKARQRSARPRTMGRGWCTAGIAATGGVRRGHGGSRSGRGLRAAGVAATGGVR
jgi:hypothetical protein